MNEEKSTADRLKQARLVDSVDLTSDLDNIEEWRSVRPIYVVLALIPLVGTIGFILFRFRFFAGRLVRFLSRLSRWRKNLKRTGSIALRILEAGSERD